MRNAILSLAVAMAALLTSCGGGGEDKTLYGSWEFVQEMDDSTHQWKPYQEDFFVIVTGSCEEIDVELQHYGDLTDADKATNAKCYGNRDQLDFTEPRFENTFQCKMDATKDTLLCTSKRHYDSGIGVPEGGMDVVLQYKLARIQY